VINVPKIIIRLKKNEKHPALNVQPVELRQTEAQVVLLVLQVRSWKK
jgi:hypothetical protein|tara:strand:- start:646 stop:786 length:141 start_codon:yes stop_codon:yes gene_type:complete